ncbi:hypothetical protein GQ53DRAFT_456466 [Thozetella sp. PMI_491]|nr:hypothetical protein GQ53DRAFT_456466 [Thozetella sp. PMI_491]
MKSVAVVVAAAAFAGVAMAQSLPDCATSCANQFFVNGGYGNCGNNVKCICSDSSFLSNIACCLAGTCSPADQTAAVSYAQQLCNGAGVSVPSAVSCTSTSAPASQTSGSVSATTTPPSNGTITTGSPASASSTSTSHNYGPRQTPMAGLGAIGGLVAAVALL